MRRNNYIAVKLDEDKIVAVNCFLKNDLSLIDCKTGEVTTLFKDGGFIKREMNPINMITRYDKYLLLMDDMGTEIAYLNLYETTEIEYYPIGMKIYSRSCPQYICCEIFDHRLYIFAAHEDTLLVFNLKEKTIERIDKFLGGVEAEDSQKIFISGIRKNNHILLLSASGKNVYDFDLEKNKWVQHTLCISEKLKNAIYGNDRIYCLAESGKIFVLDVNWHAEYYEVSGDYSKPQIEDAVFGMAVSSDKLYLLPALGNHIFQINLLDGSSKIVTELPENYLYHMTFSTQYKFFLSTESANKYCFANPTEDYLLLINKKDGKMTWLKPKLSNIKEDVLRFIQNGGYVEEYEGSLVEFIECISENRKVR